MIKEPQEPGGGGSGVSTEKENKKAAAVVVVRSLSTISSSHGYPDAGECGASLLASFSFSFSCASGLWFPSSQCSF